MGARVYAQKEWRLLSWWLATQHPNAEILMNVRVGLTQPVVGVATSASGDTQLGRVKNRWADAIFLENGEVSIVESKLDPDPGIFSQLVHYLRKFIADPTFAEWQGFPRRLIALVYNDDPSVAQEAPWYGVRWVVYQPALTGFAPPMVKGIALGTSVVPLPVDWAARLNSWGVASVADIQG